MMVAVLAVTSQLLHTFIKTSIRNEQMKMLQGVQMAQECKAANLEGFPMWVINGKRISGEQRFSQLEAALEKPN